MLVNKLWKRMDKVEQEKRYARTECVCTCTCNIVCVCVCVCVCVVNLFRPFCPVICRSVGSLPLCVFVSIPALPAFESAYTLSGPVF